LAKTARDTVGAGRACFDGESEKNKCGHCIPIIIVGRVHAKVLIEIKQKRGYIRMQQELYNTNP